MTKSGSATVATNWQQKLDDRVQRLAPPGDGDDDYAGANARMIRRILAGFGVDGPDRNDAAGYRIVVNMSSAHIGSFVKDRYLNAYDRKERLGADAPSQRRQRVDYALAEVAHCMQEKLYFAAVELNGSGIRFYGDVCLVLKPDAGDANLTVLDRNSYDLLREPLVTRIEHRCTHAGVTLEAARTEVAREISGKINPDLAPMAALKVLASRPPASRLLSTAMISTGVLEDEDYIEVLRTETFTLKQVAEARLAAPDVALDERIRTRSVAGLPLSAAEQLWQQRRRDAEAALAGEDITVRVVTNAGRPGG